jgi:hypothetical protein
VAPLDPALMVGEEPRQRGVRVLPIGLVCPHLAELRVLNEEPALSLVAGSESPGASKGSAGITAAHRVPQRHRRQRKDKQLERESC